MDVITKYGSGSPVDMTFELPKNSKIYFIQWDSNIAVDANTERWYYYISDQWLPTDFQLSKFFGNFNYPVAAATLYRVPPFERAFHGWMIDDTKLYIRNVTYNCNLNDLIINVFYKRD